MNCNCVRCGSSNTKALSLIHQDGQRHLAYSRSGWSLYKGRIGIHSSSTKGVSATQASHLAKPPTGPCLSLFGNSISVWLVIIALLILTGFNILLTLSLLVGFVFFGSIIDGYIDPETQARWERTFRCNRCGNVFEAQIN